jgi:hypothetical protein
MTEIKNVIATPEKYLASISDYYHAYLIDKNSMTYGLKDT